MLTVDFDRLGVGAGTKVIDVGCGAGRHSFEAYRRGADVIAFDQNAADLNDVDEILQAMKDQGEAPRRPAQRQSRAMHSTYLCRRHFRLRHRVGDPRACSRGRPGDRRTGSDVETRWSAGDHGSPVAA
jgi:hypothetical protein